VNDQTLAYLAFAQYDDKELIRQVFRVGSSGIMSLEKLESHYQPTSWRYTINPPTPQYECPGNLLFLVRRAKEDTRDIFNNGMPKRAMEEMPVWAFPNASDLAPRRLVNAANNIKAKGSEADSLRQLICGNDFSPQASHGLFTDEQFLRLSREDAGRVHSMLSELSPSQLQAFDQMRHSPYPLVFVQGPFGTGKTKFISTVLQIATIIRLSWMGCAPSNPVVDLLATEMERACPEMGAIRFHSLASEARALRRSEQELAAEFDLDKKDKEVPEEDYIVPIEEDA